MHLSQELPRVRLLVTDFDNTLYDWFASWYPAFSAMLEIICDSSGIAREQLLREIREVNQRRRTSEYSYLLNELPSLTRLHPHEDVAKVYDDAIHRFRSIRQRTLRLYPGVKDALIRIKQMGIPIVVYTESLAYHSAWRLRRLTLDGVVDCLYSPNDHDFPPSITVDKLRTLPSEFYNLKETSHFSTPAGVLKPNGQVLSSIIEDRGVAASEVAYVGDSLIKDVAMAQHVGALDVLAKYGTVQDQNEYELLRQVTYWTDVDVMRERQINESPSVTPTYVLHERFDEIFQLFRFESQR
jgi:phosphoglycolate phosphatase-like HAD superfamily hydrolase